MSAAARRLAVLGTLDLGDLELELAELDRARAGLAGLIDALRHHDENAPREQAPGLAGVAEAADRIGLNVATDGGIPPDRLIVIPPGGSIEDAVTALEQAEDASADAVDQERAGAEEALEQARADAARGDTLRIVEGPPGPDVDVEDLADRALTRVETGDLPPLEPVRPAQDDPPAGPEASPSPPQEAPAPEQQEPEAPAPPSHYSAPTGLDERILTVFAARRGEWLSRADVLAVLEGPAPGNITFSRATRRLTDAGELERKGAGSGTRYRRPQADGDQDPPEDPPEPANEPQEAPEAPEEAPQPETPRTVPGFRAGATPAALAAAAPIRPAQPHAPAPPKSGRLRRLEESERRRQERESRRLELAAETGAGAGAGKPRGSLAPETISGRALTALAYRPDTLTGLGRALGVKDKAELEELVAAVRELADEGLLRVRQTTGGSTVYHVTDVIPVGA